MAKRLIFLCLYVLLLCAGFRLDARENSTYSLVVKDKVKLTFGQAVGAIGADTGGGEHWKPLFFAIDKSGAIHIPDFYKNRIAVFDFAGNLKEAKLCREGLSPRMNYFCLSPQGHYITISDYYVYLLDAKAELIWKKELGIGNIPEFVYANEAGLFIVLPLGEKRTLVFDYSNPNPLGRLALKQAEENIPLLMSTEGAYFTLRLSQMKKIDGIASGAYKADAEATLVCIATGNQSLWKQHRVQFEVFYHFSSAGKLLRKATLTFQETREGSGFWTITDEKLNIYKNYFYDDYMEVISYTWQAK